MRKVSSYRAWVYLFNGILIFLQLIFLRIFWNISHDPRIKLFPLERIEYLVGFTLLSIVIQFCVCIFGILGVYFSNRYIIRVYWLLMLPILVLDTLQIALWAYSFACIHKEFEYEIIQVFESQFIANGPSKFTNEVLCTQWNFVQLEFACCAPERIFKNCGDMSGICHINPKSNCHFPLLKWLHSNTDILAILLYLIIYPIKWISLCVLREDISELFADILYSNNQDLYKHWLVIEQQESDDSQQSSQLSSPNEYSLVSNGQNGSLIH
jgi:hypothetical protein